MKSYTDLEQSKKLAEILPIESADMYIYKNVFFGALSCFNDTTQIGEYIKLTDKESRAYPCWSLAALLDVLPNNENISTSLSKGGYRISTLECTDSWFVDYEDETNGLNNCVTSADNQVDACVDMIIKLHEENLL